MSAQPERKRLRKRLRVPSGLLLLMLSALSVYAYAEWAVSDKTTQSRIADTNKILGDTKDGTVTRSLQYLREVDKGDFSNTADNQKKYEDPELKWEKKDYDKPSSVNVDIDTRCKKGKVPDPPEVAGTKLAARTPTTGSRDLFDESYKLCKEIVETEKAQFKYNLMMSELAGKRYERYWAIADERNKLKENDAGKLQSNSNKMAALQALISIDAAQQKSYNDVYNARISYLKASRDAIAVNLVNGGTSSGSGNATSKLKEAGKKAAVETLAIEAMHAAFNDKHLQAERAEAVRGVE